MRRARFCAFVLLVIAAATPLRAQQPPPPPPDTVLALPDTVLTDSAGITPRTAMIRSWLLPGWGQASVGTYTRGAFFVAAQGGSWYMLVKTLAKLSEARNTERVRVDWVSDSLRAIIANDPDGAGKELSDPVRFQEIVDEDARVVAARSLVSSRSQQRQDWITGTLFLTLVSGLDAFVAAHLADAPVSVETAVTPDRGLRLGVRFPLDRRR